MKVLNNAILLISLISNNSPTGYGTSTLVKNDLNVENVCFNTEGRIIIFDIGNMTFGNVYLPAGTDALSRSARENYCSEILPNLSVTRPEV